MAEKTIPLTEPLVGHKGPITALKVRPPRWNEYVRIGPIERVVRYNDGSGSIQTDREALSEYMKACLVEPSGADVLLIETQLPLKESILLERAILDFFDEAAIPTPPPTTSSSGPDGVPPSSAP